MYSTIQTPSKSPTSNSFMSGLSSIEQMNYKERANKLFEKLNSFKNNLENQKFEKFSEVLEELKSVENKLEITSQEKQQHFDTVIATLVYIDKEINQQKIQFDRFKKMLQNLMENTNRQCQAVFDKMVRQSENNQAAITKFIDFKIESFVLKSNFVFMIDKGVWLQQDLLNFQPYKEELNYMKKQVQEFYKNQQKQVQKLKRQLSDNLDKQKQFLLGEVKRTENEELMRMIENICADLTKRILQMIQRRQNVEKNVLLMIENVIDSYIKDSKKFK